MDQITVAVNEVDIDMTDAQLEASAALATTLEEKQKADDRAGEVEKQLVEREASLEREAKQKEAAKIKQKADRKARQQLWQKEVEEEGRRYEMAREAREAFKVAEDKRKKEAETMKKEEHEKKVKKIVFGREAFWNDILVWEEDDGCLLMELPLEVLDLCFGHSHKSTNLAVSGRQTLQRYRS